MKSSQNSEYVSLGDVCRNLIGMQCQYGSRYAETYCAHLRIKGNCGDYHSMTIHKDDAKEYARTVLSIRLFAGIISKEEYDKRISAL